MFQLIPEFDTRSCYPKPKPCPRNMLIGVLCEVVGVVAQIEEPPATVWKPTLSRSLLCFKCSSRLLRSPYLISDLDGEGPHEASAETDCSSADDVADACMLPKMHPQQEERAFHDEAQRLAMQIRPASFLLNSRSTLLCEHLELDEWERQVKAKTACLPEHERPRAQGATPQAQKLRNQT